MSERDETEATRREGRVDSAKKPAPAPVALARGTLVGRYVVLDKLGEGGMGVVYGAFDPELDRKVAIKVLQGKDAGGSSGGDQAWLVREAQALARLAHPNVVAVHDVGSLPGDQVFVAMELVEGDTMRAWLKAKARSWREVVPVMLAAGQGLAAAHEVGLVHRDFKPENVLVGKDGRVRVMDFGLARLRADDDGITPPPRRSSDLQIDSRSPLSAELTLAGHVVGTPAYMAPEIYDQHPADARTDQFAFGVTLFEALYHQRPYDKKDLLPTRSAPPRPNVPAGAHVPNQLAKLVLRAIAIDPAERFASMRALLAELARDPFARRRAVVFAAAGAAAVLAVAGGVFAFAHHRSELCTGADARLAGVWDPHVKDAVHAAFGKTNKPFAEKSFTGLARALDGYTGEWTKAVTESCRATRISGEQTEDVMSLRTACFDQRLEEVRALSKLLVDADAGIVQKGDAVVFGLDALADCANVAVLRAPGMPPPEIKDKVASLAKRTAEARAQLVAGNYLPALVATKTVTDEAVALHWDPIAADALQIRAAALLAVGNMKEAAQVFADATWAAVRGHRDDMAAHAAFSTAMMTSEALGKPTDAQVWIDFGVALMSRAGVDHGLSTHHYQVAGMVAAESGDINRAVALYEKAYEEATLLYGGKDAPAMASTESDLGTTLSKSGAYTLAVPHYEHALALRIGSVGDEHPDVALMMSNLGLAYSHIGELQKAHDTLAKALALREKLFGKTSPFLVATLDNYGELLAKQGSYDDALAAIARAKKLAAIVPGTSHPAYHTIASDEAKILRQAGRLADAHAAFDAVLELERKNQSTVLPQTETERALLALDELKWPEAEALAQQAIDGYEASGGKDQPELWHPLTVLAQVKIAQHDAPAARTLLERAIAVAEKAHVSDYDLKPTRELLASAR